MYITFDGGYDTLPQFANDIALNPNASSDKYRIQLSSFAPVLVVFIELEPWMFMLMLGELVVSIVM